MTKADHLKFTSEREAALRASIKPQYVDVLGTESNERAMLLGEIDRLRAAITKTLDENSHLADGDNCTLIELKRAVPEWGRDD